MPVGIQNDTIPDEGNWAVRNNNNYAFTQENHFQGTTLKVSLHKYERMHVQYSSLQYYL